MSAISPPTAALTATTTGVPSLSPTHQASTGGTSASTLILVALIAVAGVCLTALVQWLIGRRTSTALKRSADAQAVVAEAAKVQAESARLSADAAAVSAKAAKDAVGVNADTAAGIRQRAHADALSKRYQDAAEQLGHDKAPVRLAGVYAMARLADDWPAQRQTCIDGSLRVPANAVG